MIAGTHPEGLTVPPATAIAHLLLRDWLDDVIGPAPGSTA
jgi:NAD+ diphosphatase